MASGPRVLHAGSDDSFVRAAVAAASGDEEWAVTSVDGGEAARERVADGSVDCVVCEADLVGGAGTALLADLQETDPELPSVYLADEDGDVDDALASGASDVVVRRESVDDRRLLARRLGNLLAGTDGREADRPAAEREIDRTDSLATEREFTDLLLDTLEDVFYLVGPGGGLRRWNGRLREVTGYADAEIAAMDATEFFRDEDRDRVAEAIATALETGSASVAADLVTSDGEPVPYEFTGARLTGPDGELRGVVGIGRDVSGRVERERTLEQIRQNVAEVVWMSSPGKESMEFISDSYADVWGRSPESLREDPSSFVDAVHPEDRERVTAALAEQRTDPDGYEETYRVVQPDGEVRWVHDRSAGVYEDGELVRIVGVASDVTERERLESELQRKATLLDHVFDQIPTSLYVKDREGRHLRKSEFYEESSDVVGKTDSEIYDADLAERTYADDMRVVEDGERILNKEEYNPETGDWTLTSKVPWRDEDGDIQGLIGVSRVITEKKEYERQLNLRNRALEEAPVGITIHDGTEPAAPITDANARFKQLTGYTETAVDGAALSLLAGPETDPERLAVVERALERGESASTVIVLYRRHGAPFWGRVSVAPVTDGDGDLTHFVGFLQDVTDTKEHAEEIERRLDEFGEVLAEELRAPLQRAEAALASVDDEGANGALETAERSVRQVDKLVDDLATVHSFSVKSRGVFDAPDAVERARGGDR